MKERLQHRLQRIKDGIIHPALAVAYFRREVLVRIFELFSAVIFDKRFHVETRIHVTQRHLFPSPNDSEIRATWYDPVAFAFLKTVLRQCRDFSPVSFVDIGCGKGRACFYAALRLKPAHIIGIDLSESLIAAARRNLSSFTEPGGKNIEFLLADARHYALPQNQSVVFLFNPFDDIILAEFIQNNIEHFRKYRSRIAYVNDKHSTALEENGFYRLTRDTCYRISTWELKA